MAYGRNRSAWSTPETEILTLLVNVHRDTKKRSKPYTSDELNPYAPKAKKTMSVEQLTREILAVSRAKARQKTPRTPKPKRRETDGR